MNNPPRMANGSALPLGARTRNGGTNFATFIRNATGVCLLLFDHPHSSTPAYELTLDPDVNRTGDIWHVWLDGINTHHLYVWRVDGPWAPELGHRFDRRNMLLDPYSTALAGTDCWESSLDRRQPDDEPNSCSTGSATRGKAKSFAFDDSFDWQDDRSPLHSWSDTVIYETHIRGFTAHPSAAVNLPGTFLGLVEKIPYLVDLGVTAIELLPVQEFYENEILRRNPLTGEQLRNYWGYSTVAFFAPKESYSSRSALGCQVSEFKTMVRELHKAGIEVILDIVFNHTAEGNHTGPTINLRGLENSTYYLLEEDQRFYRNYSGTGNTMNCNHPIVRDYILDCLRHWVTEMHVDGFRFDLASILGRDERGDLIANAPLLERLKEDPVLSRVKLIAEAWDAGGAYQLGHFCCDRWSEWNGRYRDEVRRFWRGDAGMTGALASRLCGSADIYQQSGRMPVNSINYVTAHDGFTLQDLVSYARKHNEANGDNNIDGTDANYSANYGVEGPTDDPAVTSLRWQQTRNLMATLLLSRGVPMLLGGDEFGRTQDGNNNAYCQDNNLSWYDWDLLAQNHDLYLFARNLLAIRRRFTTLCAATFYTDAEIQWFDPDRNVPDWDGPSGLLGCLIGANPGADETLALLFNATPEPVIFHLPDVCLDGEWHEILDTASPDSFVRPDSENTQRTVEGSRVQVLAHSLVVLHVENGQTTSGHPSDPHEPNAKDRGRP